MEEIGFCETSDRIWTTRCYIPEVGNIRNYYCDNVRSSIKIFSKIIKTKFKSRGTSVGIATGYGLDDRGMRVRAQAERRIFTSPYGAYWLWGPPSLLSNGYQEIFPRVKRQGREADHSPSTNSEIKKTWIYISNLPYAFMA
jgi:hypothetical protein